jgi:hypothetical protein
MPEVSKDPEMQWSELVDKRRHDLVQVIPQDLGSRDHKHAAVDVFDNGLECLHQDVVLPHRIRVVELRART